MTDRKIRTTLSAVAWCGVLLCGLALLSAASAVAAASNQEAAAIAK